MTNAHPSGDIVDGVRGQDQLDHIQALESLKRGAEKLRNLQFKQCRARIYTWPRGFDPNLDDEQPVVGPWNRYRFSECLKLIINYDIAQYALSNSFSVPSSLSLFVNQ